MVGKRIKLLVISDSHGRADRVSALARQHKDAEAIIFLGDGFRDIESIECDTSRAICAVRGNCDWFSSFSGGNEALAEERFLVFGDHHILMMHGHTKGVKGGLDVAARYAYERGADILLFGHTHSPLERYLPKGSDIGGLCTDRPMYLFNPGSLVSGSFGYIEIVGKDIIFSHGNM